MKDLIERQTAIDAINGVLVEDDACKVWFRLALQNLPPAQPYTDAEIKKMQNLEQVQFDKIRESAYQEGKADAMRWIPCSERLPNRFGKMLVTFIPGTLWTYVIIANYSDLMGIAKPCFLIGKVGKDDFANITSKVVAWMPLPEPYREDES